MTLCGWQSYPVDDTGAVDVARGVDGTLDDALPSLPRDGVFLRILDAYRHMFGL